MEKTKIDLNDFANGALKERFEQGLQDAFENILDPNTDPKKARKVTLTLTLTPNETRKVVNTDIKVQTTLQPALAVSTSMLLDFNAKGEAVGAELKSGAVGQTYFDGEQVRTDTGEPVEEAAKDDKVVRFK